MKAIQRSFLLMTRYIRHDMMLVMACIAPIMAGLFFKFGIPALDAILPISSIFVPYYGLFDIFYALLTPTMYCFIAAMVILEESDDHVASYLYATPLGKNGYLLARLGIPTCIACIATVSLLPLFSLSKFPFVLILLLSILGSFQGLIIALLVIACSSNKLEGLAITKLATLMLLGAVVPFFLHNKTQYLFSPLPTFWMGKAIQGNITGLLAIAFATSCIWLSVMWSRFKKRMV